MISWFRPYKAYAGGTSGLSIKMDTNGLQDHILKELNCFLCLKTYKQPKVLPCDHTFCAKCLVAFVDKRLFNLMPCPQCKSATDVPRGNTYKFPHNFVAEHMLECMNKLKEFGEKCGVCEEMTPLQSHCNECFMWLCKSCTKSHGKFSGTSSHKLQSTESLNKYFQTEGAQIVKALKKQKQDSDKEMKMEKDQA